LSKEDNQHVRGLRTFQKDMGALWKIILSGFKIPSEDQSKIPRRGSMIVSILLTILEGSDDGGGKAAIFLCFKLRVEPLWQHSE
jgi:hypothetical protein